jgi:hypothetical protein
MRGGGGDVHKGLARSPLRLLAAAWLGLCLSGCAMFPWAPVAVRGDTALADTAPPALRIAIEAPPELKLLLERYLDLTRLSTLTLGAK